MSNSLVINNPIHESLVFLNNIAATEPVVVNQGGTWSGKTFSIMQVMVFLTLGTVYKNEEGRQENIKSLVVGQDVPNLKKGAISDFNEVIDIIVDSFPDNCKHFFEYTYNSTDKIVRFHFNNSELQFSSFQNKQSAKAGKRHYVFMNEANGIAWTIAEQLMFRAKIRTFLDYNPDAPFWVHHKLIGKKGTKVIYSNLSHNEYVPEKVRTELIAKGKANASFHKVYILGKTGATEGIVFPNVRWIQEMPKQYKREAFGMDFGYTNDPSTMVRIVLAEGKLYAELLLYQKGMTGSDIGEWLKKSKFNKNKYLFTDVAPATIEEIRRKGFRKTRAAKKGAGSIVTGIDTIKNYGTLHIVDNVHWRAEQVGYKYQEDKATGEPTNDPEENKGVDHIWDALRYGIQGINSKRKI